MSIFGRTPRKKNLTYARPLPKEDNTAQTRTNLHILSEIRTHDPRSQAVKTNASDSAATAIGFN
jgi:hypothetical protein